MKINKPAVTDSFVNQSVPHSGTIFHYRRQIRWECVQGCSYDRWNHASVCAKARPTHFAAKKLGYLTSATARRKIDRGVAREVYLRHSNELV